MNILVLGQGGREHAIIHALLHSPQEKKIYCAPGNAGIANDVECVQLESRADLFDFCQTHHIRLVIVGPEVPLVAGVADDLRGAGIPVVGPGRDGAQLEGSKIFSKEFLFKAGVLTARYETATSASEVVAASRKIGIPCVIKADGLAAGKGVLICQTAAEVEAAAHIIFTERRFGRSGQIALVEEFLPGSELSYLILTNGREYHSLPLAQDHKRLHNGDRGPNTGGMGTVAPLPVSDELDRTIREKVVEPTLRHMTLSGMSYWGILYFGLMMTKQGPSVLEFNVRFGDPEAQVILPLLDGDWLEVFLELAQGRLIEMNWRNQSAACVVIAAEGYPDEAKTGAVISNLDEVVRKGVEIFHAGTTRNKEGKILVSGGRVLNVVAVDAQLKTALERIYGVIDQIQWKGSQFRTDIGEKVLTSSNQFESR